MSLDPDYEPPFEEAMAHFSDAEIRELIREQIDMRDFYAVDTLESELGRRADARRSLYGPDGPFPTLKGTAQRGIERGFKVRRTVETRYGTVEQYIGERSSPDEPWPWVEPESAKTFGDWEAAAVVANAIPLSEQPCAIERVREPVRNWGFGL